jgi:murein DD-endopeptidase MepM/ murein hydrolase activator NlpD
MRTSIIFLISVVLSACSSSGSDILATPVEIATVEPSLLPTESLAPKQASPDSVQVVSATPTNTLPPSTSTPQPRIATALCSPLAEHSLTQLPEIISSSYEPPPPGKDERHHGIDFFYYNHGGRASIEGEGIQSIMAGRVAAAIHDRLPYGNMVIIETPYEQLSDEIIKVLKITRGTSIYHLYAHFEDSPQVEIGDKVECGQRLGQVGKSGYVVPVAHLHLETRLGPPGITFESMVFFDTQATPEEQAAYTRWRTSGEFQHFDPILLLIPENE